MRIFAIVVIIAIFFIIMANILSVSPEPMLVSWYGIEDVHPRRYGSVSTCEDAMWCIRPNMDDLGKHYIVSYGDRKIFVTCKDIMVRYDNIGKFDGPIKLGLTKGAFRILATLEKGIIKADVVEAVIK